MAKKRQRIPKLKFTAWRDVGWHVSYRDVSTESPKKHCFGIVERGREPESRPLYHAWVLQHIGGDASKLPIQQRTPTRRRKLPSNVLLARLLPFFPRLGRGGEGVQQHGPGRAG